MSSSGYGHSCEFRHIDRALRSRWASFRQIEDEIRSFVPKTKEQIKSEAGNHRRRVQSDWPFMSPEMIDSMLEEHVDTMSSPTIQLRAQFSDRLSSECVIVVVLSHALCEALINAILAIGLGRSGKEGLFTLLDRAQLLEKWRSGPKAFLSDYSFPSSCAIYETMKRLVRMRNAFVHSKISLSVGGRQILDGSEPEWVSFGEELKWLRRFFSLAYDLSEFAANRSLVSPIPLLGSRDTIDRVSEHVFN